MRAKGRSAASTDPFIAAFVALILFLETFALGLHQLVESAHAFDLGALFLTQQQFALAP